MVAFLSRMRFTLIRMAAGLAGLALLSACETGTSPSGSAAGYNGAPVAVALLVPSGSGQATDDLIASAVSTREAGVIPMLA